jgi:hypothetical protein
MTIEPPPPPLLDTIPCGALLSRVLRLGLGEERREEFLGDLVEEAHLRLPTSSRRQLAGWIWAQALRSLPTLVGLRLQRLVEAALGSAPHCDVVLAGSRVSHAHAHGLPLSLAVSVSAHALIVVAALGWLLSRVDEVDPASAPFDLWETAVLDPGPETDGNHTTAAGPRQPAEPPAARRPRTARRRVLPSAAPAPTVLASPTTSALTGSRTAGTASTLSSSVPALVPRSSDSLVPGTAERSRPPGFDSLVQVDADQPRTYLPPQVAEKRCLACPPPRLEGMPARLASGRELLVKTCVSARGRVQSVEVVRGLDRMVNAQVVDTVRTWRLLPYRLDGRPVPFCYPIRFLFTDH